MHKLILYLECANYSLDFHAQEVMHRVHMSNASHRYDAPGWFLNQSKSAMLLRPKLWIHTFHTSPRYVAPILNISRTALPHIAKALISHFQLWNLF